MRSCQRKSAPGVVAGRVRKKNCWELSRGDYYYVPQQRPVIDRKRPGKGYRHLLQKRDIEIFLGLLPQWEELSRGLNAVVLAPGEDGADGYHTPGVVHVCAWEADLWRLSPAWYYEEHKDIYERLGVSCAPEGNAVLCRWSEPAARAYQLLHVLLHELGHHHDRMTTRSQRRASRGEPYAEAYARRHEAKIWGAYVRVFDL